ncbi:MAG: hypothetical protein Q6J68_04930 [Thermostichales cyanobacterium SZTDM-1c_bins_54]
MQDRNRRLESSLLMSMGIIRSLHRSLHISLQINRRLETALALSQQALEQVLNSSLEPEEAQAILSLIQESLKTVQQHPEYAPPPPVPNEFASVEDFSP